MRGAFWQIKLNADNERNIESESSAYHTSRVKDLVFAIWGLCGERAREREGLEGLVLSDEHETSKWGFRHFQNTSTDGFSPEVVYIGKI